MKWAIIEDAQGDVNCPHCGRLKKDIADYGVFDSDSYYYIVKCKCGQRYAYLLTSDFQFRYVGEGEFHIREACYNGSISNKV